jgi:hypothetical protein
MSSGSLDVEFSNGKRATSVERHRGWLGWKKL